MRVRGGHASSAGRHVVAEHRVGRSKIATPRVAFCGTGPLAGGCYESTNFDLRSFGAPCTVRPVERGGRSPSTPPPPEGVDVMPAVAKQLPLVSALPDVPLDSFRR